MAALAAGCSSTTLSFKPGASPDRMKTDEHACGQAGDEGFIECMRNLGWYMTGDAEKAAAAPTASAEATVVAPAAVATPVAVAPAAAAVATAVPTHAPAVAAATAVPTATHVPAPEATAAPVQSPAVAASPASSPATSGDGLPRVRVGSWWKLGGSAAGLDSSIAGCTKKLGTPHQPAPGAIIVTESMRDCLRGDGWIAYDQSPAP